MSIKGFQIDGAVQRYDYTALDNKPSADATLSVSGGFADAKIVGDEFTNVKEDLQELITRGSGITARQKELIITILRAGVYSSDQSTNINTLEELFTKTAVSITASFNSQGNTIYSDDTIDTLKQYLTVIATFDDGTTGRVTNYSLSGSLTVGTSTITVSYQDVLTIFTVTVAQAVTRYTITNNLTDVTTSNNATTIPEGNTYTATLSTSLEGYAVNDVTIMMGETNVTATAYSSDNNTIKINNVDGNIVITADAIYDTSVVVTQEDVYYSPSAIASKEGFGIANYKIEFNQDDLEASSYWDAEHQYMNTTNWCPQIKFYLPNINTVAAGYTAPNGSNSAKSWLMKDNVKTSHSSFAWNTASVVNFDRYNADVVNANSVGFSVALLDLNDSYAYWGSKTNNNQVLPVGVDGGDIIFAGKNTIYYGMHNINEYTGE